MSTRDVGIIVSDGPASLVNVDKEDVDMWLVKMPSSMHTKLFSSNIPDDRNNAELRMYEAYVDVDGGGDDRLPGKEQQASVVLPDGTQFMLDILSSDNKGSMKILTQDMSGPDVQQKTRKTVVYDERQYVLSVLVMMVMTRGAVESLKREQADIKKRQLEKRQLQQDVTVGQKRVRGEEDVVTEKILDLFQKKERYSFREINEIVQQPDVLQNVCFLHKSGPSVNSYELLPKYKMYGPKPGAAPQ